MRCLHGATRTSDERIAWSVWAPSARTVHLITWEQAGRERHAMQRAAKGWFTHEGCVAAESVRYAYQLDGGKAYPDPASRWQPEGVHRPSAVFCPEDFSWTDAGWEGVKRAALVIYELHVGAFTREGTFDAIVPRLPQLRDLGVTAIELMPIAQFPGSRNWGYDGVHPFAVQNTYGGPQGLQRLVDACHAHGMAVLLDVVWNHFGPEGNYWERFGPYISRRFSTPWGGALDYGGQGSDAVRDLVLQNARYWLNDFHLDGLRLDAVHMIMDDGPRHILCEVLAVADKVARESRRHVHVIAECDLNHVSLTGSHPIHEDGFGAIWIDDFHHAVHALLTGERHTYYADFGGLPHLAKAFNQGVVRDTQCRVTRHSISPALGASPCGTRHVVSIQNHDQVGNRPLGERLATLVCPAQQRLAAGLLLLSPYTPMLFMGEEYGEQRRFPFFCSFSDLALVQSVREGRAEAVAPSHSAAGIPDPQAECTFNGAKLSWEWPEGSWHQSLRRWYQDLLTVRRRWPALRDFRHRWAHWIGSSHDGIIEMLRGRVDETWLTSLLIYFNFSSSRRLLPAACISSNRLMRASAILSSELPCYGGGRQQMGDSVTWDDGSQILPYEVLVFAVAPRKDSTQKGGVRGLYEVSSNVESPEVASYNG
jgi:maltooligosyltrehalose trehalohydrolase